VGHRWIIDVLADLTSFARQNDLALLADQLEHAAKVASAEITKVVEGAPYAVRSDDNNSRPILEEFGGRDRT
jgi:hypothetical protein